MFFFHIVQKQKGDNNIQAYFYIEKRSIMKFSKVIIPNKNKKIGKKIEYNCISNVLVF